MNRTRRNSPDTPPSPDPDTRPSPDPDPPPSPDPDPPPSPDADTTPRSRRYRFRDRRNVDAASDGISDDVESDEADHKYSRKASAVRARRYRRNLLRGPYADE